MSARVSLYLCTIWFATIGMTQWHPARAEDGASLVLETKIPLGDVRGRIDHLAVDLDHRRVFVAELGNDSVSVIDLDARTVLQRISGLHKPQGVGYVQTTETLYVANGGTGTVNLFHGVDLTPAGSIDLGDDADNVRVDELGHHVVVGFGDGGLAIIDAMDRNKINRIALPAHPEGFQIDVSTHRIVVNIPNKHQIAVVDEESGQLLQQWPIKNLSGNFPLSINAKSQQLFTVFRHPSVLAVFDMKNGASVITAPTCDDSDDVFLDASRSHAYVSCGEGYIDVFSFGRNALNRVDHIKTSSGARTALYVPELDRLFLAVRSTLTEPAAIWIYKYPTVK